MGILAKAAADKALGAGDLETLQGSTESFGLGAEAKRRRRGAMLRTYWQNPWVRLAGDVVAARQSSAEWFLLRPRRARPSARQAFLRTLSAAAMDSKPDKAQREVVMRVVETEDFTEVWEHPLLDMLSAGTAGAPPALIMSGTAVANLERITLDLYGDFFYAIIRDSLGVPRRWWPIPPSLVRTPRRGQRDFVIRSTSVPAEDMAWFRQPRPDDPYGEGTGVADSLDHQIQIDEHSDAYLAALFRNRARPDVLIMAPGLGETERERFEVAWRQDLQGPHRSGVAHFIGLPQAMSAGGKSALAVKDLARSPADLQVTESGKARRDTIMQVWRVPQVVIGATESANRASALMGETFIRRNRTIPDLEFRRNGIQQRFFEPYHQSAPEFPGDWVLMYRLPPLEDEDLRAELMKTSPHLFAQNVLLEAAGVPPVEGGAERYFVPSQIRVTSDLDAPNPPSPPDPLTDPST